ncbi:MAG: hypothetical protein ABI056_08230 [Caulobacteraceae bacterium]
MFNTKHAYILSWASTVAKAGLVEGQMKGMVAIGGGIKIVAALAMSGAVISGCSRQKEISAPQIGRFVIVHSAEVERDTILLDTATGRTWSRVQVDDLTDEPAAWDPMPQLNSNADRAGLEHAHPPKNGAPTSSTPDTDTGGSNP